VNAADVIAALKSREVEKWSEGQINEGLAALHKECTINQSEYYNALILRLDRALESKERQKFAEQGNQQLAAMRANVEHGVKMVEQSGQIVGQLKEHHSLHKKILRWSIVAGLTGLSLVAFESWKAWREFHSNTEEPRITSIPPPQISLPASVISEPPKATNLTPQAQSKTKPPQ
jgi:hypothetical protein